MSTAATPGPAGGWEALHERFLTTLRHARSFEVAVALRLLDAGLTVQLPERSEAPDVSHAAQHSDRGDLIVAGRWIVEIKSTRYRFTCAADWPFEHGAYVTNEKAFRRRRPRPIAYVFVSQQTLAMLAVSTASEPTWKRVLTEHPDRPAYTALCAPTSALRPIEALIDAVKGAGA